MRFHAASASRSSTAARNAPSSLPLLDNARNELAVLQVLKAAGAPYARVVFTRNRRIMASVGRGGTLRLHQVFAAAPETVLHAVGICFLARRRAERARARRVLLEYFGHAYTPPPAPARARRISPTDLPHLERLQSEFTRVNQHFFGGSLPAVPLYLSALMRRRNGHFASNPQHIVIARRLCTHAFLGEAERTLRHEMIHLWQHAHGMRVGHRRDFRDWAVQLEIVPRATRDVCWREGC